MIKNLVNNYYHQFKEILRNTENQELKETYHRLMKLDEFSIELILRKSASDVVSVILMEEFDSQYLEEYLVETINGSIDIMEDINKKYVFRVKLKGLEKYVTREIAIPKDFLLSDLGISIVLAFNGDCEHLMEFNINNERYVMNPKEDYFSYQKSMFDYELSNLELNNKSKIKFIYDFGENYSFDVKFVKEVNDLGNYPIEILKGKGIGIIEDHHMFLDMYYEDPNQSMLDYIGKDISISEYLDIEEFDIEEANEYLNDNFIVMKEVYENEE